MMADNYICIATVVNKMGLEEKGALKGMLMSGKHFQNSDLFTSADLKAMGQDLTPEWVSSRLNKLFQEGFGLMDKLKGISDNYGMQLEIAIKKVLVKSLKISKPVFHESADSISGALEREAWIVEKLMETAIKNMDDETKKKLVKEIELTMVTQGFDKAEAAKAGALFFIGGITPLKAIFAARIFGPSLEILLLRLLSLSLNDFLRLSFILRAFFAGPIGWGITAASIVPTAAALINRRIYDKFLFAVFIIGSARIYQN